LLLGRVGERHTLFVRSEYGVMALHHHRSDGGQPRGVLRASWPLPPGPAPPGLRGRWADLGFGYALGRHGRRQRPPAVAGAVLGRRAGGLRVARRLVCGMGSPPATCEAGPVPRLRLRPPRHAGTLPRVRDGGCRVGWWGSRPNAVESELIGPMRATRPHCGQTDHTGWLWRF
jgi:hypothetical protein